MNGQAEANLEHMKMALKEIMSVYDQALKYGEQAISDPWGQNEDLADCRHRLYCRALEIREEIECNCRVCSCPEQADLINEWEQIRGSYRKKFFEQSQRMECAFAQVTSGQTKLLCQVNAQIRAQQSYLKFK